MAFRRFGIGLAAVALSLAAVGCEDSCLTCGGSSTQVRGYVRDGNGIGLEGETVHVLGKPPVLTGSDGSFLFNDVATPYDLVYDGGANDAIRVWRGMTEREPVILGYTGVFAGLDSARVSGSAPASPERNTVVFFMAPDMVVGTRANVTGMAYSLRLGWLADAQPRSGRMFLLRFRQDPSTLQFLEFDGFASQPLEVYPSGVYRVDLVSVEDPLDRTITGTVAVPAGYEAISAQLWMEAEQQTAPLGYSLVQGGEFAFVAPTLPGVTYRVGIDSRSTDRARVFTALGGLQSWDRADLTVRAAPELLVPQQGQVVDRATPLSWQDDGAPVLHIVQVHSSRRYVIHVVGTETRLDDLPGPGLVAGGTASCNIYRIDGQNVVDPSFRDSPRESFASSDTIGFWVASQPASQP